MAESAHQRAKVFSLEMVEKSHKFPGLFLGQIKNIGRRASEGGGQGLHAAAPGSQGVRVVPVAPYGDLLAPGFFYSRNFLEFLSFGKLFFLLVHFSPIFPLSHNFSLRVFHAS